MSHKKLSVSQNFLTNHKLIERLIKLSSIKDYPIVIEIGTGKGHITKALCKSANVVYSLELDDKLYDYSQQKLGKIKNLILLNKDFLSYSLPVNRDYCVFANIPFAITSKILNKLCHAPNPPGDIWLVVQREVALQYLGMPRENLKSIITKTMWEAEIVHHFKRSDFHPTPRTNCVFLHLHRKLKADVPPSELRYFKKFIRFGLNNGLRGKGRIMTNKQIKAALRAASEPPIEDSPTYKQWLALYNYFKGLK